jgi:hypothetical protein
MTQRSWADRQKEIREILDQIMQGSKDKGVNNAELAALEDVAMKSFEVLETLNDSGQIDPNDPDAGGAVPLALVNLAVLMCRTSGVSPFRALQLMMSVFTLHTGIPVQIIRVGPDGETMDEDKGMSEQSIRTALDHLQAAQRGKAKADQAPVADAPVGGDAPTQDLVDRLMHEAWDTDSMKVH